MEPLKTVVMNARVHDARDGGGVSIGGGWMDGKRTELTQLSPTLTFPKKKQSAREAS